MCYLASLMILLKFDILSEFPDECHLYPSRLRIV